VNSAQGAAALPYWRLSSFYFCYFAILGAMVPYWSPYLEALGFSAVEIGRLLAIVAVTRIVAPYVGGWIADRTGARMLLVRLACAGTVLAFTGMFGARGFWTVAAVTALFSIFWNAALPQFEVATLSHLGARAHHYGRVRLWGSVGFIGVVAGAGWLLEYGGIELLVPLMLGLMGSALIASLTVPEAPAPAHVAAAQGRSRLEARLSVAGLFAAALLMQASHGPYYGFYSIHLEAHGYPRPWVGALWALGVVAEVALFYVLGRLLPAVGARALLIASLLTAALRWVLLAHAGVGLALLAAAQLLHAATFGAFHAAALALVQALYPPRLHGRGQALYTGIGFGVGGALGGLGAGYLWEHGGAPLAFDVAAALAAAGALLAYAGIRPPARAPAAGS
jgi:MFS transporter, PPP family, 3-phenylpropionic acid transporter